MDTPSAILQLAPSVLPEDWESIADEFGLRGGFPWLKLASKLERPPALGAIHDIIMGGLAQKFPKLRFGAIESGVYT